MNIIDCKCSTWALTIKEDWEALKNGEHHPGCDKNKDKQMQMIRRICEEEIQHEGTGFILAQDIIEILDAE